MNQLRTLYTNWTTLLTWLQAPFLLAIRLYWGSAFLLGGWGKLTHLSRTADYFKTLVIPFPEVSSCLAGTTELLGGLLLIIGLGSRIVTVPLLFVLGIAYATAEHEALHAIWSNPDKFTAAAPFLFAMACLTVLLFGPGRLSIDAIMGCCCKKKSGE